MAGGRMVDEPAIYELRVKGTFEAEWAGYWFEGMAVIPMPNGETVLVGQVSDSSALLGLLSRIHNLGLPLLSVIRRMEGET